MGLLHSVGSGLGRLRTEGLRESTIRVQNEHRRRIGGRYRVALPPRLPCFPFTSRLPCTHHLKAIGYGRSGHLWRLACDPSNPKVWKLASTSSPRHDELQHEVRIYSRLEALQGSFIPDCTSQDRFQTCSAAITSSSTSQCPRLVAPCNKRSSEHRSPLANRSVLAL